MTRFLAPALIALAGPAMAGNADAYWAERQIIAPAPQTWAGPYAGLSVGRTTAETTRPITHSVERVEQRSHQHEVNPTYLRECVLGSGHSGNKCTVSATDWTTSPELQALAEVTSPWNVHGFRRDGQPGDLARYDAGYWGVWMNDTPTFRYTTPEGDSGDPERGNRGADNTLVEVIRNFTSVTHPVTITDEIAGTETVETTDTAYGAFAGLRQQWGGVVGGVELGVIGDLLSADVSVGVDGGRVLPYAFVGAGQFDGAGGLTYGAGVDVRLGERSPWLVGARQTFFDGDASAAQVTMIRLAREF